MEMRNMAAVAGLSICALSISMATAAGATEPSESVSVELDMALVGFDREVASANGYEIRTTPDGREYSVLIGTPSDFVPALEDTAPPPVGAGNSVNGSNDTRRSNCGSSSISVDEYEVTTGYSVRAGVLFAKWGATVDSATKHEDFNFDHDNTGPMWSDHRKVSFDHKGFGGAFVNSGSFVLLTDGGLCESLQPRTFHTFQ